MWTSGVLATRENPNILLRVRHRQKVEVVGVTTDNTGPIPVLTADCISLYDGAMLVVPVEQVRDVRAEEREARVIDGRQC